MWWVWRPSGVHFLGAQIKGSVYPDAIQCWLKDQAAGFMQLPATGAYCFVDYPGGEPFAQQRSDTRKLATADLACELHQDSAIKPR